MVEILLSLLLISIAVIPFLKYFFDSAQLEFFTRRELTSDYVAQQTLEEVKAGKIKVTDILSFEKGAYTIRIIKTPLNLVTSSGSEISTGDLGTVDFQDRLVLFQSGADLILSTDTLGSTQVPSDLSVLTLKLEGTSGAVLLSIATKDSQGVVRQVGSSSYSPASDGFYLELVARQLLTDQHVTITNLSSVIFNVYAQTDGGNGFSLTQTVDETQQPILIQYGSLTDAADTTNTEKTYHIVVEIYQDGQLIEYVDSVLRE